MKVVFRISHLSNPEVREGVTRVNTFPVKAYPEEEWTMELTFKDGHKECRWISWHEIIVEEENGKTLESSTS